LSRKKGDIAEKKAIKYLKEHNFTTIDINFYSKFGEIDIISKKNNVLHFVEVKSALTYELAIQNITPQKLAKLIKTGDVFMKKNKLDIDFQYDAVIVTPQTITHIENITI